MMYSHLPNEDHIAGMVSEAVGSLQEKSDLEAIVRQVVERLLAGMEERLKAVIRSAQEVILNHLHGAGEVAPPSEEPQGS